MMGGADRNCRNCKSIGGKHDARLEGLEFEVVARLFYVVSQELPSDSAFHGLTAALFATSAAASQQLTGGKCKNLSNRLSRERQRFVQPEVGT